MDAVTTLPRSRPLTRADLDAMPDDGHRHELVDGALVVTPAPRPRHQTAVLRLAVLLDRACPKDLQVFVAPLDVALAEDTVLEPDVLVAPRADLTERDLAAAPVLAVEVLSPSTRLIDLHLKRARYEAAGTPSYWVVDPDEPSLTAWELRDGGYFGVAHAIGHEVLETDAPVAVRFTPADLLR
ncbi:Uma2 family endonuclease [Georgenia ruanii]|uniref:Uma2 family endonuclease n=1 Tax=Georgenia ruanii TaxID=348442 RepID=A0A7J9UVN4_9MICO|nr:Uma2 family endonuclease [Georgenia ruanii]MPV88433.1 Uma2 family endonuclease [Georgenia ruanii]